MPKVRFQVTSLACIKTEDRGLLDVRSEDEVYLHGAAWAADQSKMLIVGNPGQPADAPFRYASIKDGEDVSFPEAEDNTWVVDLPEDAQLVVGLCAHEEDAMRQWPTTIELRSMLTEATGRVIGLAHMSGRPPTADELVGASTSVMRGLERFEVDDFLGKLLVDGVSVRDLRPDGFERSCKFVGGRRVLATDFDYTLNYRISRDDRDFAATADDNDLRRLALKPAESSTIEISFTNTGRAAFSADDVVLVGPPEMSGWLGQSEKITLTDDAAGILMNEAVVAPGEKMTFTVAINAPALLGRASYQLRLFVPSFKFYPKHTPIAVELASGRNMTCEVQTIQANAGFGATITVIACDAETNEPLVGTVKVTGDTATYKTGESFSVRSNMGQTIAESGAGGQGDRVVWPFGSVQVESYWPQLISLKPQ